MDVRIRHKEGWVPKNWCFQTVVLENTLENHLDCKEIKPVNPKENQLWIFIGRTDAKTEAPVLWLPDLKSQLIGKDPDAGKDWGQEEKGATEDEMVGWHHQKNQKLGSYWLNLNVSHSVFPWPWVTRVLWLWSSLWVLCSCFSTCKRKELVSLSWNISSCSKTIYSELHQKSLYHIS